MKISYRRIKKAKAKIDQERPLKPWEHIAILAGERRIKLRKLVSTRTVLSAMSAAGGAARILAIQQSLGISKEEKAIRIATSVIDTALSISKAMQYDF